MTRINVVPVQELTNKHLMAEYRELPRVFALARKWHDRNGNPKQLPDAYTLGTGHVKFFYNKLKYCYNRQVALYRECLRRGFNVTHNPKDGDFLSAPDELFNDYIPTEHALQINRERIAIRLKEAQQRKELRYEQGKYQESYQTA